MKYGYLTIKRRFKDEKGLWKCDCVCDCGNEVTVYLGNVQRGLTKSCGCYQKKVLKQLYTKSNRFDIDEEKGIAIGYTTNTNKAFYIDLADYDRVKKLSWYEADTGYIHHKDTKVISLHRFITNAPDGKVVDHLNHNVADNRRGNLRICTSRENNLNRAVEPIGVSKKVQDGRTYFIVQVDGYRGCFKNYNDAKALRDKLIEERRRSYL